MGLMRRVLLVLVFLAPLVAADLALSRWHGSLYGGQSQSRSAVDMLLDVLGEARTFLGRILWFKLDVYHHAMQRQGIPPEKSEDLLPFYRLVTILDPRFAEAYDVGAYDLAVNFGRREEGLRFLEEGLRNNPDVPQLHFTRAFLLFRMRRYADAIPSAREAYRLSPEHIDRLSAVRIMAYASHGMEDFEGEREALRLWLQLNPGDRVALERLEKLPKSAREGGPR